VEDKQFTDENFLAEAIVVDQQRAWLQLANIPQRLCSYENNTCIKTYQ